MQSRNPAGSCHRGVPMKALVVCLGVVFGVTYSSAAPIPKDADAVKTELAKLEGTWRVVACQKDGVEEDADDVALHPLLIFKDGKYSWGKNGPWHEIARIDPTQTPKEIEYKPDGEEK